MRAYSLPENLDIALPSLSRQQIIAWSVVALAILLIGASYLRGQLQGGGREAETPAVVTVGLKEEQSKGIKVHVAGAVAQPGLYEFSNGDRIADALSRAGGATPEADLSLINLAAKLADGQQVAVPQKGAQPSAATGDSTSAASGSGITAAGQQVNLNSATADQLENLDGVGPKTAQKIIEYREAHGGFQSIDELLEVPGIGSAKFESIREQVCV